MNRIIEELIVCSYSDNYEEPSQVITLNTAVEYCFESYNKAIDDVLIDLKGLTYHKMSHSSLKEHFNKLKK